MAEQIAALVHRQRQETDGVTHYEVHLGNGTACLVSLARFDSVTQIQKHHHYDDNFVNDYVDDGASSTDFPEMKPGV